MCETKSNIKADKFRDEGNVFYRRKEFLQALVCYNKSLCFSETNEAKSIAFANRSSVYLETKRYQHCLENIQLAREHGYPEEKLSKLDEREVKCRDLMKDHRTDPLEDPWNFFKLSYPANKKLPFIVECLELKEDPKYGRLIATNRDLKPGDIVLIEDPWFKYVSLDHCYDCCSSCMKENMLSLIPCNGRCVSTMYCSVECAKSAKSRHLQFECCLTIGGLPMTGIVTTKLFFDSLIIAGGMKELQACIEANEKLTIFDIDMTNPEESKVKKQQLKAFLNLHLLPTERKEINETPFKEIAKSIWKQSGQKTSIFWNTVKELELFLKTVYRLDLIGRNKNINFKYFIDSEIVKYGSSITLCSSLFNHSCDPNVIWCKVDNKGVAVVHYPIKAGEQLFLCYQKFFHETPSREARRKILLESCQFFCECNACTNNYTILDALRFVDKNFIYPQTVAQLSPLELFNDFKKNCDYLQKNFKNHPCRETILLINRNRTILGQIERLPNFQGIIKTYSYVTSSN